MERIYNIGSSHEAKINECRPFGVQSFDVEAEYSTYNEILKIFREAFSLVDVTQIIKKL
ncbi:MAG: hypothetical protein LBS20_18670 [Prevotella sp.]|jgi:hypothetical protein|uniref:hypothetical protein n=1 Tax=Dysgonomonas sp. TaxID=1891233 RepID=UPI00281B064E|nr:hypothetical protein [Prevotella sp.]